MNSATSRNPFTFARRSSQAFSLVEVLLALGIVSFVLVGLLALVANGLAGMRDARDDTSTAMIAKKLISEMQQNSLDNLVSSRFDSRYFDAEGQEVPSTDSLKVYEAQCQAALDSNSLGRITITISKTGQSGSGSVWVSYVAKN